MREMFSQNEGEADDSASDRRLPMGRRQSLFDGHRTDRAGVNGHIRYVFLALVTIIGTLVVVTAVF